VPERPLHGVLGLAREPAAQEYFRLGKSRARGSSDPSIGEVDDVVLE